MAKSLYGELPRHWQLINIGDLVERNEANLQTGPFGTQLLASEYKEAGTPVVAVKNIGDGVLTLHDDTPRVDEETHDRLQRYELDTGDIVFGRKGAVERHALVKANQKGWLQGSDCIRLRFTTDTVLPEYVSLVFGTTQHEHWMIRHSIGSTMPSLNQSILQRVSIPFPPLAEQRAIATILGTWDEAIALTEALIAALQQRKKGLMQKLLTGDVRFSEFDDELKTVKLKRYIDLLSGFAFKSDGYDDEGIKLLRGTNITIGELRWNDERTEHWSELDENLEKYLLEENDIVIGMDGSLVGRNYAKVRQDDLPALLVQRVARLRAKASLIQEYLYHNIGSIKFIRHSDRVKTVTAIPHISLKDIRNFSIVLPSISEQSKIAEILDTIDEEIRMQFEYMGQLQQQKKGLMQQLLTGQVRVAD